MWWSGGIFWEPTGDQGSLVSLLRVLACWKECVSGIGVSCEVQGSRTFRFALGWLSLFACGCWLVVPWLLRPHAGSLWVDWPSWTFAFFKVFSVPVRPFNYQWWWATNLLTGVLILRSLRHHLESCLPWCHCVNSFSVLAETLYLFIFTAVIKYTG